MNRLRITCTNFPTVLDLLLHIYGLCFQATTVDPELVDYLERIALVDFSNQEAVERLNAAIRFADQLFVVNTEGVTPQHSVLEDQ